ncbi:P-loop containing nucleoside triphosphate hydrolase protein [Hysterangium stoloniferum]|nr:P-loop containing nucleoside triphosphate hydrolase protein [Hysterangium stoloniferum]
MEEYYPTPTPPPQAPLQDPLQILRKTFNMKEFRSRQLDAIQAVLLGKDCFVRMATGSGKSLLWQLPALVQTSAAKNITIVVFPTKSLLIDQMVKLCKMFPDFEPIWYCNILPPAILQSNALEVLDYHEFLPHALLTVPECLSVTNELRWKIDSIHRAGKLGRFVVDEADKILDWGDSFRDAYAELATALRETFQDVPILALSGSATINDIQRTTTALGRQNVVHISDSLNRPNLFYEVRTKHGDDPQVIQDIKQLVKKLSRRCGQGIVYCATHKDTANLGYRLRNQGIATKEYTSKLTGEQGKDTLASWKTGETQVIVATSAFGMGIGEVRWVVHHTMPSSIEAWVQESGRAGRDGKKAHCIIYFDINDVKKVQTIISNSLINIDLQERWKRLHEMEALIMDSTLCRRKRLLAYFGDYYALDNCNGCDCCVAGDSGGSDIVDVTGSAIDAINLLVSMMNEGGRKHWTERKLASAIKGAKWAFKQYHGWKGFGCQLPLQGGQNATAEQIKAFISTLIHKQLIGEYRRDVQTRSGKSFCQIYIKVSAPIICN